MGRAVLGFLFGSVLGFAGLYVAFLGAIRVVEGPDLFAAERRNMPLETYLQRVEGEYERPFLLVAGVAATFCGVLGASVFNRPVNGKCPATDRHPDAGEPLTRDEFYQVLRACEWMPLDQRPPEFVRGLAVGRLADKHAALARKVDGLGDARMAALHHDLCRKQARGL
jgi:hypothetical protein